MRHTVDLICNNKGNCSYEYNQEVLFNHIQSELCINARYENRTIGMIKIRQKPLKLVCSKHSYSSHETRSTKSSTKQDVQRQDPVLRTGVANKYPGYSACEHTCGGLLCGCFLPVQACSFIRVAQIPISKPVYEVGIHSHAYVTQSHEEIALTVISIQRPSSSLFDQRFAISQEEALVIPNNFELPVRCPTANIAAKNFANCSNQMVCNCNSYKTPQSCHCPQQAIRDIRAEIENRLPIYTPSVDLSYDDMQIYAHSTKSEVTLAIKSSLLISSAEFIMEQ
ncbi:hypothetical protein COOONC_17424 [Cooperia oncophora]